MTLFSACTVASLIAYAADIAASGIGSIQSKKLHLRSEPGIHSKSLAVLEKGTKVKVIGSSDGWLKIMYNEKIGYVRNRQKYIRVEKISGKTSDGKASAGSKIEAYQKKAESLQLEIKKSNKEVLSITKKEKTIIKQLNEIEIALNLAVKKSSSARSDLEEHQKKMAETQKEVKGLADEIRLNENYAAQRLTALYKLSWVGKLNIIASAESVYELAQRKTALEHILTHDEQILQHLLDQKNQLETLMKKQNLQEKQKQSLEKAYQNQVGIMKQEKAKRTRLLAEIRNRKSLELAYIESLKESAKELDLTIQALSKKKLQPIHGEKSLEKSFVEYKGLLNMPVKGKIISHFGSYRNEKFNIMNFRSGIDIKADRGEPIKAVSAGRVVFSSWFKGYGNMVIIDHGDNYYTVYANIEEIFTQKGSLVEAGEVIATVGDTGSGLGSKLYFEVRYHGRPIDPLEWIRKS